MGVGRWIRNRLRNWLLDPPEPPTTIELKVGGKIEELPIVGTAGLALICQLPGGKGMKLVTEPQAVDSNKFWAAWRHWSSDDVRWEDGDKFDPKRNR